jgi:hypothetical protein
MDVGNLGRSYLTTRLQGRDNKQDNMTLVRHITTTLSNTGEAPHYNIIWICNISNFSLGRWKSTLSTMNNICTPKCTFQIKCTRSNDLPSQKTSLDRKWSSLHIPVYVINKFKGRFFIWISCSVFKSYLL